MVFNSTATTISDKRSRVTHKLVHPQFFPISRSSGMMGWFSVGRKNGSYNCGVTVPVSQPPSSKDPSVSWFSGWVLIQRKGKENAWTQSIRSIETKPPSPGWGRSAFGTGTVLHRTRACWCVILKHNYHIMIQLPLGVCCFRWVGAKQEKKLGLIQLEHTRPGKVPLIRWAYTPVDCCNGFVRNRQKGGDKTKTCTPGWLTLSNIS